MTPDSQLTQLQEQLKAVTLKAEDYEQSIAILKSELDKVDLRSARFKAERDKLEAELEAARKAANRLIQFTKHHVTCPQASLYPSDICYCGLNKAKAALAGGEEA